jgi:hypothetical protein
MVQVDIRPREDVLYVERLGGWDEYERNQGASSERPRLEIVEDLPPLEVGRVLAVGPGKDQGKVPMLVGEGDLVLFGRYGGAEHGRDHLFLREAEVHAIVEG